MFQGFNDSTLKYYQAIRRENSKKTYKENEPLYLKWVKYPLEEMYFEFYRYFSCLDQDLLSNQKKCISSAYNDARFCYDSPIKEYFYLRFKLDTVSRKNAPGFFFDASLEGYKYGLKLYYPDARGMDRIRNFLLENKNSARKAIEDLNRTNLLEVQGVKYKRIRFPEEEPIFRDWLERKSISFIHEDRLERIFFERDLLNCALSAFESVKDIYFMIKEAL